MEKDFIQLVRDRLKSDLPGRLAHLEMMSYIRDSAADIRKSEVAYREGAVMMLLHRNVRGWSTVLIERNSYEGVHSAQMAFPGGKRDPEDRDLMDTALRETHEEIGVHGDDIEVLGELSEIFIPPSKFVVRPFVGVLKSPPVFIPDPREVADVFSWPIESLLHQNAIKDATVIVGGDNVKLKVKAFKAGGRVVWGATAMMLSEFRHMLQK
ncbi:MAG: NUDIX domain-containing protein [Cryomorphaceae bacterium]|nr:NUDIX domain-containing protein [Cryomorphaceae bacterium]